MTIKQKHSGDLKQNISPASLKAIKNILFTGREIDIIACLLCGRSYKKIASILSVSPKTVEHHVRNVMQKVGYNSREGIIDFIEKSGKLTSFKIHYESILIKTFFEQELKKLSSITKENNINCLIFHNESQITKTSFTYQLERHLNAAGIKIVRKTWIENKSKDFLAKKAGNKQINCIIYILSNTFIKQLQCSGYKIDQEASSLIPSAREGSSPIIFLLLDNEVPSDIRKNLSNLTCINLTESENFYFLFFELLKKILPKNNIDTVITRFKKQCEMFHNNPGLQEWTDNGGLRTNSNSIDGSDLIKEKKYFKWVVPFLVFVIGVSFIVFKINNKIEVPSTQQLQNINPNAINGKQNILLENRQKTTVFNLPPRNNKFTGREYFLDQIKKQLDKQKIGIITQTISGLGGVGKTQLATEFAYRSAEKKEYSLICWISSETGDSINHTYSELAEFLQIDTRGFSSNKIKSVIHRELGQKYMDRKILFVLDNVPTHDSIQEYLLELHKHLSSYLVPSILITTRSQHWAENSVILNNFTEEEALTFIKKHLPNEKKDSIIKLAKVLHYFPLALGQATAYIKRHTNIDDYLKLYEDKKKDFLNKFVGDKNQYNESLWKTWSIALSKLSNAARGMLFVSSYLYPDDIPIEFFDNLSIEKRANAIEELRKHSLIILVNNNRSFKIHRLLQEVIRISVNYNSKNQGILNLRDGMLKTNSYWLTKTMNLLKTKFDFNYLQPDQWGYWEGYLFQAQTVAAHAVVVPGKTLQEGLKLYIKCAMFMTCIRFDGKKSIVLWNRILSLAQQYCKGPAAKFITANISTYLAYAQLFAAEYQVAQELLSNNVLPIYHQQLPRIWPEERELLDLLRIVSFKNDINDQMRNMCDLSFSLLVLGLTQYHQGVVSEAEVSFNKALGVFGEKQLDSISQMYKTDALWNIGWVSLSSGQFVKAVRILERVKMEVDRLYVNHPHRNSDIYSSVACLMSVIGKFQEAIQLFDKSLEIKLMHFSPQHIVHADPQLKLGFTNLIVDILAAEQNFMQVEKICKSYGYNYDYTGYVYMNLGLWKVYEILAKYDKARAYMDNTLKFAKLRYKEDIYSGMAFLLTQAEIWPKLSKLYSDVPYWKLAMEANNQIFGSNHYQSARCHYMLGQALEQNNKFIESKMHYSKALAILKKQKIRHPNLKKFYTKNIEAVKAGLQRTSPA